FVVRCGLSATGDPFIRLQRNKEQVPPGGTHYERFQINYFHTSCSLGLNLSQSSARASAPAVNPQMTVAKYSKGVYSCRGDSSMESSTWNSRSQLLNTLYPSGITRLFRCHSRNRNASTPLTPA